MTNALPTTKKRIISPYYMALGGLWLAIFLWGMHAPAGRYLAMRGVSMTGLMAARLWIGSLIFWTFLILKGKVDMSFLRGNFRKVATLSVIGIYLNMMTFQYGMKYIPATLVLLLENLAPFFVILLRWKIDGKTPTRIETFCQATAFSGLLIIIAGKGGISGDWNQFLIGIILEAIAGITWAIYTYFSGRWLNSIIFKDDKADRFFPCLNFICVLLTISAILATPNLFALNLNTLEMNDYLLILMVGIFQTGIAFMLWNYALGILPVTLVSICFYMTVVFTCMNEVIFLHLRPSGVMYFGAALILGSALQLAYNQARKDKRKATLIAATETAS